MDKRDQINIVLDPATREALNELRRRDPRLPTVSTIVRELIISAARASGHTSNGVGNGTSYPILARVT